MDISQWSPLKSVVQLSHISGLTRGACSNSAYFFFFIEIHSFFSDVAL